MLNGWCVLAKGNSVSTEIDYLTQWNKPAEHSSVMKHVKNYKLRSKKCACIMEEVP